MKTIKKSGNNLSWKLVWDADTKDVLFLRETEFELEADSELRMFETKNKKDIDEKIIELGLKYDPIILEEWI